jgi:TolB-like protein/DNA-binding winged helix-turn-helix (wHTH) protein/Tfp pilus assembly protein PilF
VKHNGDKPGVLRFGSFALDPDTRELRKDGSLVKLQSQQVQLLALLAERAGHVVSREEIRQTLWDQETFVDFDQSINFCINKVRDALHDDPQNPKYIETLPRKGYRFIAQMIDTAIESDNGLAETRAATGAGKPGTRAARWLAIAGTAAALAAIVLAAVNSRWAPGGAKPIESLAVLPLENLSHDPEQEYFADGMTEELITDLAKISALRVISRTSVMQYKATQKPIPQIARELNVDAVLEGTVTRDQGRVRITAQLIRAVPEKHLWAEKYEASLGDVLTVQDAVAKAVAHEIQIKVTPREQAAMATRRAVDPTAHEAYLKGRYLWGPGGEKNLKMSLDYFQQAIKKDPGYALAWAGLADAYNRLGSWGVLSRKDAAPRARAAAEKALELDSSLVEPVVALALIKADYEWDWAGAMQLCKRAIELSPNFGQAHQAYATILDTVGQVQEAVAEVRRAHQVEPLDSVFAANLSWKLYLAHQYDEAELECRKWREWHPRERGDYIMASVYLATGRQREAVAELREGVAGPEPGVLELMYLGHALGVTGARSEGQKVLKEMLELSHSRYVPPEYIAIVYEGLGERERALQWFEKAVDERSMNGWILPDSRLDPIRADPRFRTLLRRMGLLK